MKYKIEKLYKEIQSNKDTLSVDDIEKKLQVILIKSGMIKCRHAFEDFVCTVCGFKMRTCHSCKQRKPLFGSYDLCHDCFGKVQAKYPFVDG